MLLEKQKNEMKRHEAWRVYFALLVLCMSVRESDSTSMQWVNVYMIALRCSPPLPYPPASAVWRTQELLPPPQRSMKQFEEQPPNRKIATDGPILGMPTNSSPPYMEGKAVAPTPLGDLNVCPFVLFTNV